MATLEYRPNVVFIDCHDLGTWLGCYGRPYMRTPNLDRLAAEGARFDRYFGTAPICMPSRATIYTGRYPHNAGAFGQMPFDEDCLHMGERFRRNGYATILCGWNLKSTATQAGYTVVLDEHPEHPRAVSRVAEHVAGLRDDQPFLAHFSFKLVHRPYGQVFDPAVARLVPVPPHWPHDQRVRDDLATLCHQVEELDGRAGRILDWLHDAGLEERTLVVFTTEHGAALLRAKHTLYDPGIHLALLMRLPGCIPAGTTYDELVSMLDLLPSVLDLAGLSSTPEVLNVQGRSFSALFDPAAGYQPREAVFSEHTWDRGGIGPVTENLYVPRRSVRTLRHKLIWNVSAVPPTIDTNWLERFYGDATMLRAIEQRWGVPSPEWELYAVDDDPHELTNLARSPQHQEHLVGLRALLEAHLAATSDPVWCEPDKPIPHREGFPEAQMWWRGDDHRFHLAPGCPSVGAPGREWPFAMAGG